MDESLKKVEAVLFSVGRKVSTEELLQLTNITNIDDLKSILYQLQDHYETNDSSLMLIEDNDSWKLTVKDNFIPIMQNIVTDTELSKTVMETLAVIAWRYPILQSDVIKIRTNKAYDHLKILEENSFISRTKFSRTNQIKLTDKFFSYFDLPNDRQKAHDKFKELISDKIKKKLDKTQKDITKQEQALVDKREKVKQLEELRRKEKEQQEKLDKGEIDLDYIDRQLEKLQNKPEIQLNPDIKTNIAAEQEGLPQQQQLQQPQQQAAQEAVQHAVQESINLTSAQPKTNSAELAEDKKEAAKTEETLNDSK